MEIDNQTLNSTLMSQQSLSDEYNRLRLEAQKNSAPITNYETAKFLIDNSDITKELTEIEKEVKLANLPHDWALTAFSLISSYHDLILLDDIQLKKFANTVPDFTEEQFKSGDITENQLALYNSVKEFETKKFDALNCLRQALSLSTISRGLDGFERRQQNTVISSSNIEQSFDPGSKPGVIKRLMGRF